MRSVRSILACTGAPQHKRPMADVSAMPVVGNGNLSAMSVIDNRYMQIFSEDFCARNWKRTINIHHSFLPAFEGELVLCV
jgi:formyltetrahydrofolate hydrolase